MPCSPDTPTPFKYLFIRTPGESTLDEFEIPNGFRNDEYLKIPVHPNEYTRLVEGEKSTLQKSFVRTLFSPRLVRVGFNVRVNITEANVFSCLEYVATISASTGFETYTAIEILDFCRPEVEDMRYAIINNTSPYTVRYGMIKVDESSGLLGLSPETLSLDSGFGFNFMEVNDRLVI